MTYKRPRPPKDPMVVNDPEKHVKATGGSPYDHTGVEEDVLPESFSMTAGRLTLTPTSIERMRRMVEQGVPIPTAVTACGGGAEYKKWGLRARKADTEGIEPGFEPGQSIDLYWLKQMDQARSAFEASMVMTISATADKDWRAAAWILERRASRRYYMPTKMLIESKDSGTVEISAMSTAKLISIAKGLLPDADVKSLPAMGSPDADTITDGEILDEELAK